MDTVERLLIELNNIGNMSKGARLDTSREIIAPMTCTWPYTSAFRALYKQNRVRDTNAVVRRVDMAIHISELTMQMQCLTQTDSADRAKHIDTLKNIYFSLSKCMNGVVNMRETYTDDSEITSVLDRLLDRMAKHTTKIADLLVKIGEFTTNTRCAIHPFVVCSRFV